MPKVIASDNGSDGVQINLFSGNRTTNLTSMERIRLTPDGVRDGNIVILEEDLSPDEELELIEVTMAEISPDEFNGIEIETYPRSQTADRSFLDWLMDRQSTQKLTIIGPANQIQTLHKDENLISALVSRKQRVPRTSPRVTQHQHLPVPYQCTTYGKVFPGGSKEMLPGCLNCGGDKFQFKLASDGNAPASAGDDTSPTGGAGTRGLSSSAADAVRGRAQQRSYLDSTDEESMTVSDWVDANADVNAPQRSEIDDTVGPTRSEPSSTGAAGLSDASDTTNVGGEPEDKPYGWGG